MADPATDQAAAAESGPDLTGGEQAAALEAGRLLFASRCEFFFGAQSLDQVPPSRSPEVAFAGRSNVGKSSLVNALTGQRALARASGQPGRTRQLNFFDLGEGRLTLVDMPGYGYAQAPKNVKADWQGMMFDYLRGRPTLRRVMLLLDARIEVKAADRAVMELLDQAAVAFQLVLTKADGVDQRRSGREAGGGGETRPRAPGRLSGHRRDQRRNRPRHRRTAGGLGGTRPALSAAPLLAGDGGLGASSAAPATAELPSHPPEAGRARPRIT